MKCFVLVFTCLNHQSCVRVPRAIALIQPCYVTLKYNAIVKTLEEFLELLIYKNVHIT